MRTHNITTLTSEIYDKLANNTNYFDRFNPEEVGLEHMEVDENAGVITIKYQDKTFEIVVREAIK